MAQSGGGKDAYFHGFTFLTFREEFMTGRAIAYATVSEGNERCIFSNAFHSPSSTLQDDIFQVFVIHQPCSRLALLAILLDIEIGTHFETSEHAEMTTCTAYRLDPADERKSFNDLDGEVVESGRIQGYVVPSAVNIFCAACTIYLL